MMMMMMMMMMRARTATLSWLLLVLCAVHVHECRAQLPFPARRMRMIVTVEHQSQLPQYVSLLEKYRGAINIASSYCYSVGPLAPTSTLPDDNFCLKDFTTPIQQRIPEMHVHPIIQMGGDNALHNFGRAEIFAKLFVAEALKLNYSGYFLDVEFHGDEHYENAKKYRDFLHVFGSALHEHNKSMTVLSRSVDSHATPASILNVIGGLDGFVVESGTHEVKLIEEFVRAMGYRFKPRGGALLYPHGELNSKPDIQWVLSAMTQSGCQELAFFANFQDMGGVMLTEMKRWLEGANNGTMHGVRQ